MVNVKLKNCILHWCKYSTIDKKPLVKWHFHMWIRGVTANFHLEGAMRHQIFGPLLVMTVVTKETIWLEWTDKKSFEILTLYIGQNVLQF